MKDNSISLILPCYNEESNLRKGVLDIVGSYTEADNRFQEVLIIDDGSTDDSKRLIKESYLKKYPKFRLIENDHTGKAYAIISGIRESKSDYVFFSDFDLATPLRESEKLFREINKGFQVVIGSRSTNRSGAPLARKILAMGFMIIRNVLIGLRGITDTQCGFKIFDRNVALEVVDKLQVFKQEHVITAPSVSAGFDIEFLFIAKKLGCKIKEVPVAWRHVESKRVEFVKDAIETLGDIVKIRFNQLSNGYDFSKKKHIIDIL